MKSILDPTFAYTPSVSTDLRKSFARHRERIAAEVAKPPGLRVVADTGSQTHLSIFNARRGK